MPGGVPTALSAPDREYQTAKGTTPNGMQQNLYGSSSRGSQRAKVMLGTMPDVSGQSPNHARQAAAGDTFRSRVKHFVTNRTDLLEVRDAIEKGDATADRLDKSG